MGIPVLRWEEGRETGDPLAIPPRVSSSPERFAAELTRSVDDPRLRRALEDGSNALAKASDVALVVERWAALYHDVTEGAVREALEETGVASEPVSLVGVFDSRLCGTVSRHHLYQLVFLCQPLNDQEIKEPSHANEVLDVQWFTYDALPEDIDPGHVTRIPVAFQVWRDGASAFFDKA